MFLRAEVEVSWELCGAPAQAPDQRASRTSGKLEEDREERVRLACGKNERKENGKEWNQRGGRVSEMEWEEKKRAEDRRR